MPQMTDKQSAYINDLIAERRADLDRASRYIRHIEGTVDAVDIEIIAPRIAALTATIEQIERGDYTNVSAAITALRGISDLARWGMKSPGADKNLMMKIASRGLHIAPNFK
jgi:hypothetical protein